MLERINSPEIIRATFKTNPFVNDWLFSDFFYRREKTEIFGEVKDGILSSYILIYYGLEEPVVIVYNYLPEMLSYINVVRGKRTVITVFGDYEEIFKEISKTERALLRDNLLLYAKKVNFYPGARGLTLEDKKAYEDFKSKVGWFKNSNFSTNIYGSFEGEKLVSVATRMGENDYCKIGGVYTLKEYRGKGHAKKVVSLISKECIENNLTPFLIVYSKNEPAIRVYKAVGFEELLHFKWIKLNGYTTFDEETLS